MMDFDDFGGQIAGKPLSQADKAAAVLLAMGKGVAGKLLKYFTQAELQTIIASAQTLRTIPPDELTELVNEFEDLFTEGTGLMDNAKAIEGILEEGLTPRRSTASSDAAPPSRLTKPRSGSGCRMQTPISFPSS